MVHSVRNPQHACWLGSSDNRNPLPSRHAKITNSTMNSKSNSHPEPQTQSVPGQRPVTTLRMGRIAAAIWENKVNDRPFYNVTFSRSYVDSDQNFHKDRKSTRLNSSHLGI